MIRGSLITAVLSVLVLLFMQPDSVQAQSKKGMLRVRFEDNAPLTMTVNNRDFRRTAASLTVGDLPKGRSYLKVYHFRPYTDGGGHASLVFAGKVRIRAGEITYCIIDRNTGRMYTYTRLPGPGGSYTDSLFDGAPATAGRAAPGGLRSGAGVSGGQNIQGAGLQPVQRAVTEPLTGKMLDRLSVDMAGLLDDAGKLEMLGRKLEDKTLTTTQTAQLARGFGTDESRLAFLKQVAARVSDPEQYSKLEAVLVYDSSKESFREFLKLLAE